MTRKLAVMLAGVVLACGLLKAAPCWASAKAIGRVQQGAGDAVRAGAKCVSGIDCRLSSGGVGC